MGISFFMKINSIWRAYLILVLYRNIRLTFNLNKIAYIVWRMSKAIIFFYFSHWNIREFANKKFTYNKSHLVSISSTFYALIFCTKFLAPKCQTQNTGLTLLAQKFCTKNARIEHWWNWHLYSLWDALLITDVFLIFF